MAVRNAVHAETEAEVYGESHQTRLADLARAADSSLTRLDLRIVAAVVYALLVVAMWGSFAFSSGMPGETGFVFQSETQSAWQGFWYGDPLRPNTSNFYQLSYLLGQVFGITGSFAPYQFVYAALWWAKGFLLFLLMRRWFPGALFISYIVGALAIVHASDTALQWVGQLNQLGFMLWLLLALYFLTVAVQQLNKIHTAVCLVLAGFFQYMCLWSYESPLFIVLFAPLLVGFLVRPSLKQLWTRSIVWYVVPLFYIFLSLKRYFHGAGTTYQETVLRKTWSVDALLSDLAFNVTASVSFWSWRLQREYISASQEHRLAAFATVVFIVAGMAFIFYKKRRNQAAADPDFDFAVTWKLFAAGCVLLILSFPAYLALAYSRTLWRTQLLSGIGAAMVLGGAFALMASLIPKRRFGDFVVMSMSAVVVFYGASRAVERGAFFRWNWHRHQVAIQQVIRSAPQLRPETIIVLVGVPKENDPLGHNYWFDLALRLAYPKVPVAGIFYYSDRSPGVGNTLTLSANHWHWDGTSFVPLVREASLEQTIVLEYQADGASRVLTELPEFVCTGGCSHELYNPSLRITGHTPSPIAVRRYGPL